MILAIALLFALLAIVAHADPTCGPKACEPGSSLGANFLTILESMRTATANSLNRTYTVKLPSPDVLGISTCHTIITVFDCVSCLNNSIDEIKVKCAGSIAASYTHGGRGMFYSKE